MTTDDFILEQKERSQRQQTNHRRSERSRRRQLILLVSFACGLCLVILAPSMVSHSSIGRSYLVDSLASHGLQADVKSVRIGWVTPLQITDLKINGKAGSQLAIEQLDLNLTVSDLLTGPDDLGQINLRGVAVACSMSDGECSLEKDFETFLTSNSEGSATLAKVQLQDVSISITESSTGQLWALTQSNADLMFSQNEIQASVAGVLSEPNGNDGSLQGTIKLVDATGATSGGSWLLDLSCESLPISIATLLRKRFPEAAIAIPSRIHGDATGSMSVAGNSNGTVEANLKSFEIRNLMVSDPGTRVWKNERAALNGKLILEGERLVGRELQAHTDFGTAIIDGVFSRKFSLMGSHDNPLRWLEAIDGNASANIDLPALERALPGLLPLREGAKLNSGRVLANLVSIPDGDQQRKELQLSCEALQAESRGKEFVIDPITLTATVSNTDGRLQAEHFEWNSTFGSAIGSGNLEAGSADFNIDFGHLTTMLLPIFEMTDTRFSGNAQGKVAWKSGDHDVWRLTGNGQTTNLLIQLPGGRNIKRNAMRASIEAEGRWMDQSLKELSKASVVINSLGLDIEAKLTEPVTELSRSAQLPFLIVAEGRLDTLEGILDPWIPENINNLSGAFSMDAHAAVGLSETLVTSTAIELNAPKLNYGSRNFQQPLVKIQFDGNYHWPANAMQARSITVVGDAFSLAVHGNATGQSIAMDIKYRAKLDRIQGSVNEQIAANEVIRPVAYRPNQPVQSDAWMVLGDCEGEVSLRSLNQELIVEFSSTGKDIAVLQPAKEHATVQTVGPWPQLETQQRAKATVVWSEPNLEVGGRLRYKPSSEDIVAEQVQVAGDWFATTMSGSATWAADSREIRLSGPSRLKMDEVTQRLSQLAGMDIRATGIHEANLSIHSFGKPDGEIGFVIATEMGWESGEIAGMNLGRSAIPIVLTETSVEVAQTTIPISEGDLSFAGQVHYRPGPLWMHLEPGTTADSIRLTPEMTDRWLKYLAPLVANTTRIEGTLGAQIDEAIIVFDQPEQTQISGRVNIGNVQMNAGPLASEIIQSVSELRSLANGFGSQPAPAAPTTNLVTMPPQTVDFAVRQGVVSHERLYLELDRVQVVTSGRVGFDGSLNMIAQVPLDARWLGNDIQALAGQVVTLPIDGSISRPSLDSSGIRQIATQLGIQAVQSNAENYLQQQLNKSLNKIFGR